MQYLYLHGFASGPKSTKAQALKAQFQSLGLSLRVLDLNQPDFSHLTLTAQIRHGAAQVTPPATLIGSSLGGLVAAWVAERVPVTRLVLLAPAFGFLDQWLPRLGAERVAQWQRTDWLPVYHYAQQRQLPLHYGFVDDARPYTDAALSAPVPTLILHGQRDTVVSLTGSLTYAATRPWVTLKSLPTDHAMTDAIATIWQEIQQFCGLE